MAHRTVVAARITEVLLEAQDVQILEFVLHPFHRTIGRRIVGEQDSWLNTFQSTQ
jgi:hypothetical protein